MSKSAVAGISGSVRIQRLSGVALSAAEAHGKRLDNTGKVRSISNDPVITTTGLDLNKLYETHVSGALIHKSSTKALHMVLQYPTNLVSGDGANSMLVHARRFAKSVFGDNAIFADRVDRDEKSRHVVDLFIAPKHLKDYKIDKNGKIPPSRQKVSTSKDLKALAEKFGRAPTLRGQGQALQDAWFDYLKGIGLGVQRGQAKKRPGDDWLSPEELEIKRQRDELDLRQATFDKALEASKQKAMEKIQAQADRLNDENRKIKSALNAQNLAFDAEKVAFEVLKQQAKREEERLEAKESDLDARLNRQERTMQLRNDELASEGRKISEASQRLDMRQNDASRRETDLKHREDAHSAKVQILEHRFGVLEKRENDIVSRERSLNSDKALFDKNFEDFNNRNKDLYNRERNFSQKLETNENVLFVYNSLKELKLGNKTLSGLIANINYHIKNSDLSFEFKNAVNTFSNKLINVTKVIDISNGYKIKSKINEKNKNSEIERD